MGTGPRSMAPLTGALIEMLGPAAVAILAVSLSTLPVLFVIRTQKLVAVEILAVTRVLELVPTGVFVGPLAP